MTRDGVKSEEKYILTRYIPLHTTFTHPLQINFPLFTLISFSLWFRMKFFLLFT